MDDFVCCVMCYPVQAEAAQWADPLSKELYQTSRKLSKAQTNFYRRPRLIVGYGVCGSVNEDDSLSGYWLALMTEAPSSSLNRPSISTSLQVTTYRRQSKGTIQLYYMNPKLNFHTDLQKRSMQLVNQYQRIGAWQNTNYVKNKALIWNVFGYFAHLRLKSA
jgi:hypothetical protein